MVDDPSDNESAGAEVFCPYCAAAQDAAPGERAQLLVCGSCGRTFILPAADGSTPPVARVGGEDGFIVIDDSAQSDGAADESDELDGVRIRQLAQARRAAYRSRSYCLIGSAVAAAAAGQLVYKAIVNVRIAGWSIAPILYLAIVGPALYLAWRLLCRARKIGQEARASLLVEPTAPPDFGPLSDGSQVWRRLEQ